MKFLKTQKIKLIIIVSYIIVLLSAIFYLNLANLDSYLVIGIGLSLAMLPLFFLRLEYALLAFVIIRPAIDIYSQYNVITLFNIDLNVNALLGTAIFIWGLFYIVFQRINLRKIPGFFVILIFFILSIISEFITISKVDTLAEIIKISNIFIFFILAFYLVNKSPNFLHKLISALAIGAIIPCFAAIYQFFTQTGLTFGDLSNRVYGTFGHPNVLGFYLILAIALLLLKFISQDKHLRHPLTLLAIGSLFIILLLTYTRAAWLGLAIFLLTLGFLQYKKALFITAGLICFILLFGQLINIFLVNNTDYDLRNLPIVSRFTQRSEEADSLAWRWQVVKDVSPRIWDSPVFGHGLGTFPLIREQQDVGFFEDLNAHNDYLRLAVEMGILGLLSYVFIYILLFKNILHNYLVFPKNSQIKKLSLGALGLLIAFAAISLSDNLLQHTPVVWGLWMFFGAVLGMKR